MMSIGGPHKVLPSHGLSSLRYHLDGFHGAIERLEAEIGDAG